jgi:molecular chaperone DnaJ
MRGKGLPHLDSGRRGDLLVRLIAWTPAKLSRDEDELLQRLDKLESNKLPGPRRPG